MSLRRTRYLAAARHLAAVAQARSSANAATTYVTTSPQPNVTAASPPPVATASGSVHYALWNCIHSREGAWNAQTGNGYYGGLQMTYGWDGLVQNAALLSPAAQMQAAETGYRQSGYSVAWLEGQWPVSSRSCLQYR
jgi:hypothetical protein